MREVLASTAERSTPKCEPKPTEVGEARGRANRNEVIAYQGVLNTEGCPRCGDRCGDTLKGFNSHALQPSKRRSVLEKTFEPRYREAPSCKLIGMNQPPGCSPHAVRRTAY